MKEDLEAQQWGDNWSLSQGGDAWAESEIKEDINWAKWCLKERSSRQRGQRPEQPLLVVGQRLKKWSEQGPVEDKWRWKVWEKSLGGT